MRPPVPQQPHRGVRLTGLTESPLIYHHDNNNAGAVKNLNRLEQVLAQVTKDTPAFVSGGLRQSELMLRNSMTLHEAYFGNLGGDGKAGSTDLDRRRPSLIGHASHGQVQLPTNGPVPGHLFQLHESRTVSGVVCGLSGVDGMDLD